MIENIKYIIGAIIGFAIAFIIFGRSPDVTVQKDTIYINSVSHNNTSTQAISNLQVSGAQAITLKPDGTFVYTGNDLHLNTSTSLVSSAIINTNNMFRDSKSEKTITYNGSVYVLWNPFELKVIPSVIGASYVIINPLEIQAQYNLDIQKLGVGPRLKF